MVSRWLLAVSCLLWATIMLMVQPTTAKEDKPRITANKFDSEPFELFYFEDTDTVIFQDLRTGNLHRSFDGGEVFDVVEGKDGEMKNQVIDVRPHTFDKNKAYVLGAAGTHWITRDQGKTFESFQIEVPPSIQNPTLAFHGWDSRKVIFHGALCFGFHCLERPFYTTDDFKTVKPLRDGIVTCSWAVGEPQFATNLDIASQIEDRILCVVPGLKSFANRLVYTDHFFDDNEDGTEVKLHRGRPVSGVINTAAVKKYLVAAAQSPGTDEHALYVSDDSIVWHRAEFGKHRLEQDAYTILESTNYSIQVDVETSLHSHGMGNLYSSNSNGTYFTRNIAHTNRKPNGYIDFEKVANIQGIILVNIVKNWEEVQQQNVKKNVVSRISFDDGRTFQNLKVGDENLHLHSVTTASNTGRVFSSPAPGILMGVGNTGGGLKSFSEGNLYVSDDAGVTWRLARKGPHQYEFGDQGAVVMAISDNGGKTDEIAYSINHGKDWETTKLSAKVHPKFLTTTPDSTSLKFVLVGSASKAMDSEYTIFAIDYSGLHERKCEKDDFEKWPARLNEQGDPDCLMGHKQFYHRRKANADCFVDEEFKDPLPIFERCKCSSEDFECDYNFVRSEDGKSCSPAVSLIPPKGECQKPTDTYKGPSGWRLIPGNACIREGGEHLDADIERSCGDVGSSPADGSISVKKHSFDGEKDSRSFYYLERQMTSSGNDETIMFVTDKRDLYISHDHGKKWEQPLKNQKIIGIIPHRSYGDGAFFLTGNSKVFWTFDRGHTFKSFKAPTEQGALKFHPQFKNWLIWTGPEKCTANSCPFNAYFSKDRGSTWGRILKNGSECIFVGKRDGEESGDRILCLQSENDNPKNPLQLVSSDNFFAESEVHIRDVFDIASMAEYIVVASRDPEQTKSMRASTSIDGRTFADAEFPPNVDVPVQTMYTVVDSSSHAIFLHVTTNSLENAAHGLLIKSNSNGTSYVLSIAGVNRNDLGYIDFEKMQVLEGVAVVNVVSNIHNVDKKGAMKKLRTMITHNDGAQWRLLPPPAKDADGNDFGCSVKDGEGTEACALHLHGFTERRDPGDTFSSGSAIGLMMGVGNVGSHLDSEMGADTFLTQDAGITWKAVKKGRYMYEYGDSGSVIAIVPESKPTKSLFYSLNEGDTWTEYQFTEAEMHIEDITTVPSDTSKSFLLWGKEMGKSTLVTVNVDFSGLRSESCKLNEDAGEDESDDYYLWEPKHPLQDGNCLFGHIEQYHRKKPSADCWNNWREPHVHSIGQNCTCTRADYEW